MIPTAAVVVAANASAIGPGRLELLAPERGLDLVGAAFEVALPAAAFERGADLTDRQARPAAGVGALASTARQSLWARSSNATSAAG